jgi:DNA-directed RNA polymerase specialized sigma24 family protein
MSAALQIPGLWAAATTHAALSEVRSEELETRPEAAPWVTHEKQLVRTLAFYRKHTESLLRRYLYASMLVGRTPPLIEREAGRGGASCRQVHTFEESVNFVLDLERCLASLNALDRCLLSRIVLQEYTVSETAIILRLSTNTVAVRLGLATDRLTRILLEEGLLELPR